jgi:hypothetical protein
VDRQVLKGQTILLIEKQPGSARNLQSALDRFGVEVALARAMEALERLDEFDFSLAVLDWSPDSPEHSAIARRLKEEGVRFLFCARRAPEDVTTGWGAPSSQNQLRPRRSSKLARLAHAAQQRCAWVMARPRTAINWTSSTQVSWATVRCCSKMLNARWRAICARGRSPFGCALRRGDTGARDRPWLQAHARQVGQCNSRCKGLNCGSRVRL